MPNDPIINDMLDRLIRAFDPLKIILFGSRARGEGRADSDVDLLVVMPEGTNRRAAAVAMRRRLADMPVAKDVIVTTPDEIDRQRNDVGSVIRPALIEGRVLHERR